MDGHLNYSELVEKENKELKKIIDQLLNEISILNKDKNNKNLNFKRVLSIDGGGIRGLYIAMLIAKIENKKGIYFKDYFDSFNGVSTGSIIAALLFLGFTGKEIYNLYLSLFNKIFKNKSIFFPHYSIKNLEKIVKKTLYEIFQNKITIKKGKILNILSFNKTKDNTEIFTFKDFNYSLLVSAIVASCAAPTYFEPYKYISENNEIYELIDGSLITRSPTLMAYSISNKVFHTNNIKILSLGAISNRDITSQGYLKTYHTIRNIFYTGMEADIDYTDICMKYIMGNNNYIRLELLIDKEIKLDEITPELLNIINNMEYYYQKYFEKKVNLFMEE